LRRRGGLDSKFATGWGVEREENAEQPEGAEVFAERQMRDDIDERNVRDVFAMSAIDILVG
jgi:hypothetical protein